MGLLTGLIQGLGSLAGGAIGGAGPDPTYGRVGLDNAGASARGGMLKRSQESVGDFANRNLEGIATDPTQANAQRTEGTARSMSALGMSSAPEQAAALNQKVNQRYASQLAGVERDAKIKGIDQSFAAKSTNAKAQTAQDQVNQQQDMIEKQAFEEAEANRNAVFSQVLSGLGGFAVKAGTNFSGFMNQMNTPANKMTSEQQAQQKSIDNSAFGGAVQGGLKSLFGG